MRNKISLLHCSLTALASAAAQVQTPAGYPRYELTQITSLLNGKPKPLGEIASYYSPGRKIVVWVDPGRPDEARLHKENTTYFLPLIFLALFLALFIAYMRSKND
jgi:hypothetical protein